MSTTKHTAGHVFPIGAVCVACSTVSERNKWEGREREGDPFVRVHYPSEEHYMNIPCSRCGYTFKESKERNA